MQRATAGSPRNTHISVAVLRYVFGLAVAVDFAAGAVTADRIVDGHDMLVVEPVFVAAVAAIPGVVATVAGVAIVDVAAAAVLSFELWLTLNPGALGAAAAVEDFLEPDQTSNYLHLAPTH